MGQDERLERMTDAHTSIVGPDGGVGAIDSRRCAYWANGVPDKYKAVVYGGTRDGDVVELYGAASHWQLKRNDRKFATYSGSDFIPLDPRTEVYVLRRLVFDDGQGPLLAHYLTPNSLPMVENDQVKADAIKHGTLLPFGSQ